MGFGEMEREELEEEVGISGGCIWVDKHTIYRDRRLGGKHEEGRRCLQLRCTRFLGS